MEKRIIHMEMLLQWSGHEAVIRVGQLFDWRNRIYKYKIQSICYKIEYTSAFEQHGRIRRNSASDLGLIQPAAQIRQEPQKDNKKWNHAQNNLLFK